MQPERQAADNIVASRFPQEYACSIIKWVGPISVNKWALFARGDFNQRIAIQSLANELQVLQKEGFVKAVTDRYASRLH